jgi:hypothetical protein
MSRRRIVKSALLAAAAHALITRPRMLRWGATEEELEEPFPGAGLIPDAERTGTMAVTIDAPPSAVWPWLVQMGCDRAGWYSLDRLDNGGVPSAEQIHPEWQRLEVGERIAATPSASLFFEVAAVEPQRFLALRAPLDMTGGQFDPAGPRPAAYVDLIWAFRLEELEGGRTRLVTSQYESAQPRLVHAIVKFLLWEPVHWVMQRGQFENIKRRAEAASR